MPNIQTIPRTVVRTYLQAARLPLNAAEAVLNREGAEDWAPTLAFDAAEAAVLQFVGSLLKDDELISQGRLAEARVAQLRRAIELETKAEAKRAEADADYRERVETDEQRRQRIARETDQREAALAQEKSRKKQAADQQARQQADAARKAEAAQQKVVAKKERTARATRVAAEPQAITEERKALAADEVVLDLDAALRTTKAARKAK
jgi:colicin import membrane protein